MSIRLCAVAQRRLLAGLLILASSLPAWSDGGDPVRGESIFKSKCATCHAPKAAVTAKAYPRLEGLGQDYIAAQLSGFRSGERQDLIMSELARDLPTADIRDVAAYVGSLSPTSAHPASRVAPVGERLFSQGNSSSGVPACQSCHGPRGGGLAAAGIPRIAGQPALYLWAELVAFKSAERSNAAGEIMRTVASRLSEREIQDLANYISGLE